MLSKYPDIKRIYLTAAHLTVLFSTHLNEKFHPERLVQSDGRKLGGAVVDQLVGPAVSGQAGHVHDVAVLPGDHGRQEGLQGPEVSQNVDIECPDDLGVRCVEQSRPGDNPSVVHQDGYVAHVRLGLLGSVVDGFP